MTSDYVHRNLLSLATTMKDVEKFVEELTSARILFFSKTKMKNRLLHNLYSLRAKNTQLMTSITLEILSRVKKTGEIVHAPLPLPIRPSNTVEFDLGYAFYHGICRPRNFILAVEHFKEVSIFC